MRQVVEAARDRQQVLTLQVPVAGAYVGFAKAILGDHSLGMQGRGRIDPGAVIRPDPGEWHPRMPERLGENELADWRAGRDAIYQLAALTVGARLAVADG